MIDIWDGFQHTPYILSHRIDTITDIQIATATTNTPIGTITSCRGATRAV
jgi:hypothetical protein